MTLSWGLLLSVGQVVLVVFTATFILLERRSPTATLAWITMVAALPLVGVAIYLLVGPQHLQRRKLRLRLVRDRIGELLREWKQARAKLLSLEGQLMRAGAQLGHLPPEEVREVQLFTDGDDCYDALVAAIAGARRHVHLEYYIFRDDTTGLRIVEALEERARAGTEVRLLVDAVAEGLGHATVRRMRHAGVDVRFFNRVRPFRLWWRILNFRSHRKIAVIDGWIGFTGGMNVTDDHSVRAKGQAAWRDTHVRIVGPATHGLQATFMQNWLFATGHDLGCDRRERFASLFPPTPAGEELADVMTFGHHDGSVATPAPAAGSAPVAPVQIAQILASGPDDDVYAIEAFYFAAITSAHERLWLTTPYFVPGEAILAAIASAAHRGVDVRLLVPHKTDSTWVDAASRTYHDELLAAGAQIYLYESPMLHAKTAIVDEAVAIVGTANLDNRSFRLNFEVVAVFYGGHCVADLARAFEADLAHAKPQELREAKSPFLQRLLASAARLLAPQL
jgi:cardiolipin synthase A/B